LWSQSSDLDKTVEENKMTYEIKENDETTEILLNGKVIETFADYKMAAIAFNQYKFYSNPAIQKSSMANLEFINAYDKGAYRA
jgi:hypothetical protein